MRPARRRAQFDTTISPIIDRQRAVKQICCAILCDLVRFWCLTWRVEIIRPTMFFPAIGFDSCKSQARTKTPAGRNIAPLVRPFDDPLPPEQRDLDFITYSFFYHDTAYLTVDRAEMDRKMFAALEPGLSMTGYDPQRSMRISQPRSCRRNQTVGLGVPAPKSIIGEPRASPPSINFILSRKVRLLFQ